MKKSVKILTLVLSLALLCGVFAVAAFADDTAEIVGVTTRFSTNFDGGKTLNDGDGTVVKDFAIDNKGSGTSSTVIDDKGNSYFSWKYPVAAAAGTAGNYSYTAPNSGKAWISPPDAMFDGYCYGDLLYYVADFDIWFPKDVPDGSVTMYAYNYYIKGTATKDETTGEVTYTATGNGTEAQPTNRTAVKFCNTANGGVAVAPGLGCGDQVPMLNGAWNHITLITSSKVVDGNIVLTHYMAVNGIIADSWDYELPEKSDAYLVDGLPRWFPKTYRIEYGNDCKGNEMNLDNFTIRTIEKNYNGNLATVLASGKGTDLATWESNIYDVEKMPYSTTVAKIGDKEFDHLQRAVAAAKGGDTITLLADVTDVVTLGDIITIDCAGFACPQPKGANGYVVGPMQDGKYVPEAAQAELMIMWGGCTCGLPTCDETHPGDATGTLFTTAPLYSNLYASYETLGKSNDWTLEVGTDKYNLVGWMDATTGTIYSEDTTVTKEMLEVGFLMLTPIIEKTSVDVAYTKGGVEVYISGKDALKTAITKVDAGGTVKLMNNFAHVVGNVASAQNFTLDLNGFKLMVTPTNKDLGSKAGFITVKHNITVDGTKDGSAIFGYYASRDNVKDDGSIDSAVYQPDNPFFTFGTASKTLTINGGEKFYMNISHFARLNSGSKGSVINLNGGTHARDGATDGMAYIYCASGTADITVNVKNATITAGNFLSSVDTKTGNVVNIDNCKLISTGNLLNVTNAKFEAINITNSYIACNPTATDGAVVTIGEGNIIRENGTWTAGAYQYAPGTAPVAIETPVTFKAPAVQTKVDKVDGYCVVDPTSFDIFEKEYAATYTVKTEKALGVSFYDGETLLSTVYGKAGNKVVGPTAGAAESVADGWVMATKAYAYTIPADATADIKVDIKDVTEFTYTYAAGAPKLYVNYRLSDNLTINLYAPTDLPEGISNFAAYLPGSTTARTFTKGFTIGGAKYGYTSSWPGANAADSNKSWNINYTYDGQNFTYEVVVNVVDYAKKVANIYKDDAEKMEQVVALLQYVEAANKISKQTSENGLSELLAELKTTVTLRAVPETTGNTTALADYIDGVKVFAAYNTGLKFNLKDTTKTYQVFAGTTKIETEQSGSTLTFKNQSLMTWTATDLTIKVLDAEGATVAEGTYSIAAYYTEMASSLTADELAFLQATYVLGIIGDTNK